MHAALRDALRSRIGGEADAMRILYGGSMNGANAASLLAVADVDGGLVGGASLTAEKYAPIIKAAAAACCRLEREALCARSNRSEEHTSELQSLMRISYAVLCLKKKIKQRKEQPKMTVNNKQHKYHDIMIE